MLVLRHTHHSCCDHGHRFNCPASDAVVEKMKSAHLDLRQRTALQEIELLGELFVQLTTHIGHGR